MTSSLKNINTLTQFLLKKADSDPHKGDLALIIGQIQLACKMIASAVSRAPLECLLGEAGYENAQGEAVKKLDLLSNRAFINALSPSGKVCALASEEEAETLFIATPDPDRSYIVYFDPLDGSSNIDANVSIGSIFGISKKMSKGETANESEDVLQPGKQLLAAGYALYGAATMLVLTLGDGVNAFTLDHSLGEFVLTHPDIRTKPKGSIYSINEGNGLYWSDGIRSYVDKVKKSGYSLRYVGSMVADVHRTLLYGGIFMYPADSKGAPNGKLRYLYEVAPLSFIIEQAGGASSNGSLRALDIQPTHIHMRVPCFMGSRDDITALNATIQ